jgi:hypothetical protein
MKGSDLFASWDQAGSLRFGPFQSLALRTGRWTRQCQ